MPQSQVIIQVPVNKTLRDQALAAASDLGFASLQDTIRSFLHQLAQKQINLIWTTRPEPKLSLKALKRYQQMIADMDSGKEKGRSFANMEDAITYLDSL